MASFFGHPAIPVGLWLCFQSSRRLFIACLILCVLPDADVIAFRFGIPYESQWGHRGFTHSITFALSLSFLLSFFPGFFQSSRFKVFTWSFLSTLSHSILDALTNGGLGVAFLWPLTSERYFFPVRPILVSPIGLWGFLSLRGLLVMLSELLWLWLPVMLLTFFLRKRGKIS